MATEPIDLRHHGADRVIGSYLVDTEDGPALFDCGPTSCVDALEAGLRDRGLELPKSGISCSRTSISIMRARPACSCAGTPGSRCTCRRSARRTSSTRRGSSAARAGSTASRSTRSGASSPRCRRRTCASSAGEVLGLDCFPSPGHASHHVCYLAGDGTLYAGDAAGVRIQPHTTVLPPTPPPEVDPEAWSATLDEIERREPEQLALVHFGIAGNVAEHLAQLRRRLAEWVERVGAGMPEEEFEEAARADVRVDGEAAMEEYARAMPFWQSYAGLKRYWDKQRDAA